MAWHVNCNTPGFLPEGEGYTAPTWDEAQDSAVFDLERWDYDPDTLAEGVTCDDVDAALDAALADLRAAPEGKAWSYTVAPLNLCLFIVEA